jgi:hypothetical protein
MSAGTLLPTSLGVLVQTPVLMPDSDKVWMQKMSEPGLWPSLLPLESLVSTDMTLYPAEKYGTPITRNEEYI